ncbi:MAG: tail fiber protein [Spirochaetales bacterium]|nr:tail fiber protein [Spirochaetales bacterium]
MKQELKKSFLKGAAFAGGAAVFIGLTFIVAQSINTFTSGEVVSASKINANFQMAAPEGAIMAFYLSACPSGWLAADGTNSTPDLRGQFIRGLNSFGSAAGTRADGNQDPGGARSLADLQQDAFQGHRHGHRYNSGIGAEGDSHVQGGAVDLGNLFSRAGIYVADGGNGTPRTANETRPRNVALIYCMRKDT